MSDTKQNLITAKELGLRINYSSRHLTLLARSGRIPAVKRGSKWAFDIEAVCAMLDMRNDFEPDESEL